MKISINTTYSFVRFNLNYGSVLQNFALQFYLRNRGHDVSTVRDYRANPVYILKRLLNIKYGKSFWKKIKAQRQQQRFINKYIGVSKYPYFRYKDLENNCPDADCHIAGSDQIWRNSNKSRYLSYVPDEKVKISYAASFGASCISSEMERDINPLLKRFDGISVREKSGVDILKNMGLQGQMLLDPTLLLDSEEYPCKIYPQEQFSFCYFLNLNSKLDVPFEGIKEYCSSNKEKVFVTAPISYPMFRDDNLVFPSIEEWIGLYKSANHVFTNTYHGLLFCIIFRKQFLVCLQHNGNHPENERFISLLNLLNLQDRIMYPTDSHFEIQRKMEASIDYSTVENVIERMRIKTDDYFKEYGL